MRMAVKGYTNPVKNKKILRESKNSIEEALRLAQMKYWIKWLHLLNKNVIS